MQASNLARRTPVALMLAAVAALVALALGGWYWFTVHASTARQAEVAARGAQVMPFDLARTTHVFTDQPDGGIQQVVADDPADSAQIALIRSHLQAEAVKFQQGDFNDPMAIHGMTMPGLAELRQGYAQIVVAYAELPDGAQIRYTTSEPTMITALHTWFAAQRSDHGVHMMDHSGN
ncbi:hypothetical protein K2Z83_11895 [Oscillochloris sp. ZM17-4]|uniref:hypothetical protein n=1 Tax=Oscillochloris sp. ZM17-4 TaxID=2866714 RepID=UPI001C733A0D|nr:hypothetical protein [Oscillochloris sp. ZM17-4]MBX0328379.1 hypothetical protein [Oscillochloris sp. ZM17-4]